MPVRYSHFLSIINDTALDIFTQLSVSQCLSVPPGALLEAFPFCDGGVFQKVCHHVSANPVSMPVPQTLLTLRSHGEGSCPQTARSLNTTSGLALPKHWAEHPGLGIFRDCLT